MSNHDAAGHKLPAQDTDGTKRMQETRSLLTQALTRWETGERHEAIDALGAATNRLGDKQWDCDDPEGDLLELINRCYDHAFASNGKRGRWMLRNTIQLFDVVELHPDEPLDSPMLGGGRQ